MKTEKWKMREVAGSGAPSAAGTLAAAVKVTKSNIDEVAKWTGGKVSKHGNLVFIPVNQIVGDPNRQDPETGHRDIRSIQIEATAKIDDYVVKWRNLFFVVSEDKLQQGWEQEKL